MAGRTELSLRFLLLCLIGSISPQPVRKNDPYSDGKYEPVPYAQYPSGGNLDGPYAGEPQGYYPEPQGYYPEPQGYFGVPGPSWMIEEGATEKGTTEEGPEEEAVFSDVSDLEPVYSFTSRSRYQQGRSVYAQTSYGQGPYTTGLIFKGSGTPVGSGQPGSAPLKGRGW